jgi:hypothetical protein
MTDYHIGLKPILQRDINYPDINVGAIEITPIKSFSQILFFKSDTSGNNNLLAIAVAGIEAASFCE